MKLSLSPALRLADVADSCRYGALAFLNGVLGEWGKKELAAWLSGPYADVTRHARERISLANLTNPRTITPHVVNRVMREAHQEVVETLRTLSEPEGGVTFTFDALDSFVVRCEDADGVEGFVPTATPRMRLADRVLSLIAVDYLARPEDYEERLAVCTRCAIIGFDAAARARGVCRVHSASGIRFKSSPSLVAEEALAVAK